MPIKSNIKDLAPSRQQYKRQITLLSHGYSCPQAFPDGAATVYPWDTTISDWLLEARKKGTSPRQLTQGLVSKLVDLKGAKLGKFVLGDVSTVLMVARAIARENKIEFNSPCPACGHNHHVTLTIPDNLRKIGEKTKDYVGHDTITLPHCKDVVEIRPLLIEDDDWAAHRDDEDQKIGHVKVSDRVAMILRAVVNVGGGTPDTVAEASQWYHALPPSDQLYLEDQQTALTPHLDQNVAMQCDECQKKYEHSLDLNEDFFR